MTITFEKEPCTRCGGSGHYSRCEIYGTTCFKCAGSGFALTRKGAKAKKAITAFMDERFGKPASDLKPGDRVNIRPYKNYLTVQEVLPYRDAGRVEIRFKSSSYITSKDERLKVKYTNEQFFNELVPFAQTLKGAIVAPPAPQTSN